MKWSSIETLATQFIRFVISILIARQLMPEDYGIIGMLTIFIAISATFTDSGFGSALIQKKNVTDQDFSTAFYFNVGVGSLMYAIMFVSAPWIADFYKQPLLVPVTRVYLLTLLISSFSQVQSARLRKFLDFRSQAIISVSALVCSGVTGLSMSYLGFGVWALVWQGIVATAATCILLWLMSNWHPMLSFSVQSFKYLFGYGGKLLGSSLINTVYNNVSTIVIGKAYQATDLGYFTRAKSFSDLPTNIITNMVMKVNFPILAQLQDDNERLLGAYKVILRAPLFILFPILFGMSALAYPMISALLGEKWLGCAPLLIILCMGALWNPLTTINLNLLYVKGRTDLVLKLEMIKKPIAFAMLLCAIPLGIYGMCVSIALYNFVAFVFNCYYTKKLLNYGLWRQLKEILPILGYSVIMAVIVYLTSLVLPSPLLGLIFGIIIGFVSYLFMAMLFRDSSYLQFRNILVNKIAQLKRKS